ncbi:hypothetical protein Tco_0750577 [Tanacetum coccineum]|uniref:Integrase, catalytic region, zinc finger, CCHC-type, peptidase aspartic, catalytic n=1 Tax=Tanacetum coccineum TaxID=301880 RepID=A0ABQ4Z2Q4_9ASTR
MDGMILITLKMVPLILATIKENGVTRPIKYSELTYADAIQADCDIKATNIILQGLPPEERECKLYDEFDKFAYKKGETLYSGLIVPVFKQGDDPINAINHMMSFLTAVVTSRYPTTNNQLGNSPNPRKQATINDGRVTLQPIQGRKNSFATGINDTLTADLERYKEQVKVLKEGQNVDLKSKDNVSDSCEQSLEPKLYAGNVIKNTSAIVILDTKETLMLAEESHSKMLLKQQDPMESMNSSVSCPSCRPTKVEVPKELPKVSMVNTSLKKLKHHLAGFDVVVKERTMTTAITEGSWGFEHTKAYFRDEIIPFVKALKDIFNTFDQYLIDELTEVQNVFHQMEQAMEKHSLESKKFEVKMNQVLNENERLLEQVISKDIGNIIVNSSMDNASVNMHKCKKCLKLETELLNKKDFIKKETYDKLFRSLQEKALATTALKDELMKPKGKSLVDNDVSNHPSDPDMHQVNMEPITPKLLNKRSAHSAYIKNTQEEAVVLRDLVDHIKAHYPLDPALESAYKYTKLIQELLSKISKTYPSINNSGEQLVIVTPKNKDKRVRFTESVTYSGNTIMKSASHSNLVSNKPMLSSTRVKQSTSASGSQPSGNTKKDKIQQTPSSTLKNKVEAHPWKVKSSLKNKDRVVAPKGTAHVQHSKLNANYKLKCVKCNGCMLSDNHDLCVLDFINNVNAHTKSRFVKKNSKRKVWKPTGKVFTNIGYIWRPTGRTFTIVGNACPLTRITTTTEVPLRKPIALDNDTPKPTVTLVYSRKPRKSKTNVPVSNPKILQSVSANKKEPSKSWGSINSDVPSSSLDACRSFKLSSGIWTPANIRISLQSFVGLPGQERSHKLKEILEVLVWILGPKSVERASVLHQPDGVRSKRYHVVPYGEASNGIPVALVARFGVVS